MKKIISLLLILILLTAYSFCIAEDTGIQVIGGPEIETETVNLDDWKVGETAVIPGFGDITLLEADIFNEIAYDIDAWGDYSYFDSGVEADYLYLKIDILNTQTNAYNYYKVINEVVCSYDDMYKFGGWVRQVRHQQMDTFYCKGDYYLPYYKSSDTFDIQPMYRGQYIICVTIPNDVVNGKAALNVTFKIGENEFTYHHRK